MTETRTATLALILKNRGIQNEAGETLTDFNNRNRDCLDFANVSRADLKALMEAAYEMGRLSTAK